MYSYVLLVSTKNAHDEKQKQHTSKHNLQLKFFGNQIINRK